MNWDSIKSILKLSIPLIISQLGLFFVQLSDTVMIAECIVSETGDAACRMVHLRATVAHVISGSRHVASVSVTRTRRCMPKYGKCFKDVKGNYPLISPAKF